MQTAFFSIAKILPKDQATKAIKDAILKTYGIKGDKVVNMNYAAVDAALENLQQVKIPQKVTSGTGRPLVVPKFAPAFVQNVTAEIIAGRGDDLPVSVFPDDGTYMTGTTQFEKRNIATHIPVWDEESCIQCNICALVCPHAAIRPKVYEKEHLSGAPETFKSIDAKTKQMAGLAFTIQVAPEDCTGCVLCVDACPAHQKDAEGNKTELKAINMAPQPPLREAERENFDYFLNKIPDPNPLDGRFKIASLKGSQFMKPLFEFSGACLGCGETPYIKLMTQMFGDRALCANATGCSSIYGGNLPTTPFTTRADGRGPAWSNSLFEDNAEFGLGMRLTADKMGDFALEMVKKLVPEMYDDISGADQSDLEGIEAQRERVAVLLDKLNQMRETDEVSGLKSVADYLTKKSVWIIGGDGWAYDIGYGGLDHVLATGSNVNVLVLDTEVYSNTGGQASKATPRGSIAQFADLGKSTPKKDLGLMMQAYGNIYVAQVSMGANNNQTVKAMVEAERFNGPSLIIAYSRCIAHGIDMSKGLIHDDKAVKSGHWMLYRYNPDLVAKGKNPLQIDSREPSIKFEEYAYTENRFRALKTKDPERAKLLLELGQEDCDRRWNLYSQMAKMDYSFGKK